MSEPDPRTLRRADFDAVRPVPTRWSDNDMFGHLNNAVYLELFDSVLNAWMQEEIGIDEIAAHGLWAQVYVDRMTRRPVPIPDAVRTHLESAVAARAANPDTAGSPR